MPSLPSTIPTVVAGESTTTTTVSKSARTSKMISHSSMNSTSCQLCHRSNSKMKQYGHMKEHAQFRAVYEWLKHKQPVLSESTSICLPCIKQIQRNHRVWMEEGKWKPRYSVRGICKILVISRLFSWCKTTWRCLCRKKERQCGLSCSCHFCNNSPYAERETCTSENDLLVQDLLEEPLDETVVEESDGDFEDLRSEEMDNDEELRELYLVLKQMKKTRKTPLYMFDSAHSVSHALHFVQTR